jgi:hypothetical protein
MAVSISDALLPFLFAGRGGCVACLNLNALVVVVLLVVGVGKRGEACFIAESGWWGQTGVMEWNR